MLEAYNACMNSFSISDCVFIQQQEQQKYFEQFLKEQKETNQKLKQLHRLFQENRKKKQIKN